MFNFIKTYTFKYWKLYFFGFLALMITNYVATTIPLKIKEAVDYIQTPSSATSLSSIISTLIILALILAASRSLSRILIFIPGRNVEYDLRNKLYKHLLTLNNDFYQTNKVGDIMSRLINDIQS
jgi:ABC-type multidrug transport system, ATPase and permease components